MDNWTRRKFFFATLAGSVAASARKLFGTELPTEQAAAAAKGTRPLIISSANGLRALQNGMDILKKGGDTLDAVVAAVNIVEDDPNDNSVGYGGLPNEEGDVELDASVMHGPTRRAGAVASIRHLKNPSKVAKLVMERTDHLLLVGPGALRFAEAHGFERVNLLTERSRLAWLAWKESVSDRDAWGPGLASPDWKPPEERTRERISQLLDTPEKLAWAEWIEDVVLHPPTGTINCLAVNEKGDISGVTTTSGLAWKIPGRVGDSPIIGAGLFVDNEVGAAGSTGRGEENIKVSGAHTIVEMMRKGMSPTEACLEACRRVAKSYINDRTRLRRFGINFYALNKDGVHGGATLWGPRPGGRAPSYAVHDGTEAKLVPLAPLLESTAS